MSYDPERVAKGNKGVAAAQEFFLQYYKKTTTIVEKVEENAKYGDLVFRNGRHVEVKSQPIDPTVRQKNFFDVCHLSTNAKWESGGFANLAHWIDRTPEQLAQVKVVIGKGKDRRIVPFGHHPCLNLAMDSSTTASWTAYINLIEGWLYLYDQHEIIFPVCRAVQRRLYFQPGKADDRTFGVYIDLPRRIFRRLPSGVWVPWQPPHRNDALLPGPDGVEAEADYDVGLPRAAAREGA